MAERSNTEKNHKSTAQDVGTLQKRGRRRLVGAIALVLLAVIVLPMVFDPEPRQNAPTVNIRIPNEEAGKFAPKVAPPPGPQPEAAATTQPSEAVSPAKAIPPVAALDPPKPEPKPEPKPAAKVAERPAAKAPAAATTAPASGGEQFVVQVGAFASPEKIKERTDQLKEAKLPYYTEPIATANGTVTRIRLGPFASKDAADKAHDRAKALGMAPANPVAK